MSENDFYQQGPIFGPQIENLSMEIHKKLCEFFWLTLYLYQTQLDLSSTDILIYHLISQLVCNNLTLTKSYF